MGFRDDATASRARAEALERDNADLRKENEELRAEVEELRLKLRSGEKPAPTPKTPAPSAEEAKVSRQKATAYKAALIQAPVPGAFLVLAWSSSLGFIPDSFASSVYETLLVMGAVFLACSFVALWLGGKPVKTSTGFDDDQMSAVIWFWLPFILFMPVVGTIMGIARTYVLLRGRLSGSVITTTSGSARHYEAAQMSRREGWPLAFTFLILSLGWPAMFISGLATDLGSPVP